MAADRQFVTSDALIELIVSWCSYEFMVAHEMEHTNDALCRLSNWTVSEMICLRHCSEGWSLL